MLGRSIFQLGVCCLVLCACKGNYPKKKDCAADGGCPTADAGMTNGEAGSGGHAGGAASSRTQAAKVAKDAGAAASKDDAAAAKEDEPAKPEMESKPKSEGAGGAPAANSSSKKASTPSAGAGGAAMKPEKKAEAGQGGSDAQGGSGSASDQPDDSSSKAECEPTCGPCQACGDDNKTCQPVTGRDDADSCSDTRSCSSRGECLHISEAQPELGDNADSAELTQSYAQVLTFSDAATIQEIRLEVHCKESDQTFPAAWLAAAPGGIPSDTILATANVVSQSPTDNNNFALLELSKNLEEPATGPIAIVVSQTDMSCSIRLNKQTPYPNGALFTQANTLWTPAEGSMVFQVLSSQ